MQIDIMSIFSRYSVLAAGQLLVVFMCALVVIGSKFWTSVDVLGKVVALYLLLPVALSMLYGNKLLMQKRVIVAWLWSVIPGMLLILTVSYARFAMNF